jgi:hypothetical protein
MTAMGQTSVDLAASVGPTMFRRFVVCTSDPFPRRRTHGRWSPHTGGSKATRISSLDFGGAILSARRHYRSLGVAAGRGTDGKRYS